MGFSIRSELASYARLKRRCYFLFVISYGGLLAGLTYAAMTHQSPAPLDRAHPRGRPLRPSAPAAHAKLASLPFPRPARGRLRPHHLCPAGSGPVAHRGRGAGRRGGAGPHLPLLYPVQYAGKRRHTQKIRPGSEAEGLPRDGGMRFAAPCSRLSLSRATSPFACKRTKPRLGARAVRRSTGKGRRRAEKSNGSGRRKEEEAFRKEAPSSFPIWLFYNSPAFSKASRASDRRPCTSRARESTSQPFRYSGRRATLWRASDSASSGSSPPSR